MAIFVQIRNIQFKKYNNYILKIETKMNIRTIVATAVLVALPFCAQAQETKNNKVLSSELKAQVDILKTEIKLLKDRKKLDPTNGEVDADIAKKKEEIKTLTERKKVIDKAIDTKKKSEKEAKQAAAAQKKADKAQKAAESLRKDAGIDKSKSSELLSDEYDAQMDILKKEIKLLKDRKKLDPNNASIVAEIKSKEVLMKDMARKKKVFDADVKTGKKADKATRSAEKALKKHENANEKAENLKEDMKKK